MIRIISRSAFYALPLSLALACITTYTLYNNGNNDEIFITDTRAIDYLYLLTEFSATFILAFAFQFLLFSAITFLVKLFPDR
jgi:hypothetical protein